MESAEFSKSRDSTERIRKTRRSRKSVEDLELGAGTSEVPKVTKKQKGPGCLRSCLGTCCCIFWVLIVAILLVFGVLLVIFFPKKPEYKLISLDPQSEAVIEVNNKNPYGINIKSISGNFEYEGKDIGTFDAKNVQIKAKSTSELKIPLKLSLPKEIIDVCLKSKDFEVKTNFVANVSFLKIKKDGLAMRLPCPSIPADTNIQDMLNDADKLNQAKKLLAQ